MIRKLSTVILVAGLIASLSAFTLDGESEAPQVVEVLQAAADDGESVRIVFVGKKLPCDCTRKRIDTSWAALQTALGEPATLPVERLQADVDKKAVEAYKKQKAMMVLPAIYFVDGENHVLEMLQGEVTSEKFAAVVERLAGAPVPAAE